jgi:hypothetical protein
MVLREYLRYIIVSDELSLMKLCEYLFSEGLLKCFKVYPQEPGKYAIFPVPVSEESV